MMNIQISSPRARLVTNCQGHSGPGPGPGARVVPIDSGKMNIHDHVSLRTSALAIIEQSNVGKLATSTDIRMRREMIKSNGFINGGSSSLILLLFVVAYVLIVPYSVGGGLLK